MNTLIVIGWTPSGMINDPKFSTPNQSPRNFNQRCSYAYYQGVHLFTIKVFTLLLSRCSDNYRVVEIVWGLIESWKFWISYHAKRYSSSYYQGVHLVTIKVFIWLLLGLKPRGVIWGLESWGLVIIILKRNKNSQINCTIYHVLAFLSSN